MLTIRFGRRRKFAGVRVRRHHDRPGDLYCIYFCFQIRIDAPHLPPPNQIPPGVAVPGFEICLVCTPPRRPCKNALSVSLIPGIWWDLVMTNIPNCTNCAGPHYEIIPK